MNTKKCPACGEVIDRSASQCPFCQLNGLDQIFLSQESYHFWIRTEVEPHIAAMPPKVYAGCHFGLILTARGDLYGIGSNQNHQISKSTADFFNEPYLIAQDVISAAASCSHTIYITRDGECHLNGFLSARFSGFSDAKEVYGYPWYDRLWIVHQDGRLFAMGENGNEFLEKRRVILEKKLPVLKGYEIWSNYTVYWHKSDYWTTRECFSMGEDRILKTIKTSRDYKALVEQYGPGSVEIDPNPVQNPRVDLLKAICFVHQRTHLEFEPILRVVNKWVQPVPNEPGWIRDTRHRVGCIPFTKGADQKLAQAPGIKKVTGAWNGPDYLCLQADGTVQMPGGQLFDFAKYPVADLSMGWWMVLLSCKNGDVLWYRTKEDLEQGGHHIPASQLQTR